jgi:choline kinase
MTEGLILAAGRGSRMGNLTDDIPKCLLEVDRKPILLHQLDMFEKFGLNRIIIVTGYREDLIREAVGNRPNIEFIFNPFWPLTNVIGSAWFGMQAIRDTFVYAHADTIFSEEVLHCMLKAEGEIIFPYDDHPCGDEEMKIILEDGKLVKVSKQLNPDSCQGEFLGVLVAQNSIVDRLRHLVNQELADGAYNSFFEVVIQKLLDSGSDAIRPLEVTGNYWGEVDSEEDLKTVRSEFNRSIFYRSE